MKVKFFSTNYQFEFCIYRVMVHYLPMVVKPFQVDLELNYPISSSMSRLYLRSFYMPNQKYEI
jgi:hypothetical protein